MHAQNIDDREKIGKEKSEIKTEEIGFEIDGTKETKEVKGRRSERSRMRKSGKGRRMMISEY